jgi:2-C-methyl-D-erythritol 4-phosphate cytidylyltransferase
LISKAPFSLNNSEAIFAMENAIGRTSIGKNLYSRAAANTLKSEVLNTLDRSKIRAVQTPQGFAREVLSEIYATADLQPTTDDAGLAELAGIVVTTVEGSVESFKITTPFDLEMAQSFMNRK